MKPFLVHYLAMSVLIMGGVIASSANASIVLSNTRVVYEESEGEANVKLTNTGQQPLVVQSWIDDGDLDTSSSLIKSPFILMPPISRIDSNKGQTLRLIYTGDTLPKEHESVFYLNVQEIPPKADTSSDKNIIQVALRTRIKVFFRPKDIKGTQVEARQQLVRSLIKGDASWVLECTNPSSYHVSMSEVALSTGSHAHIVGDGMVAPGGKLNIPVNAISNETKEVKFKSIDDYGAIREHSYSLVK